MTEKVQRHMHVCGQQPTLPRTGRRLQSRQLACNRRRHRQRDEQALYSAGGGV
jgi:hypothetical protein